MATLAVHTIGHGTPARCTPAAVVAAVAAGGRIDFDCGSAPLTITLKRTAKVVNTSARVVIDGGNRITLSGGGRQRILYADSCDPHQTWTTSHCQDQAAPQLVVENITLADGDSSGQDFDGGGGGAIFDRGGSLTLRHVDFADNRCEPTGADLGGGAVRVLSQFRNRPVRVLNSTFTHNVCSNGGALSSIGVSWDISHSTFLANRAVGRGANPAAPGTPGGGSGGAIYNDGDTMTLSIRHSVLEHNHAREGGGAVFFVSDDRSGTMSIRDSQLRDNPNLGFQTAGLPGIFFLGARRPTLTGSQLR